MGNLRRKTNPPMVEPSASRVYCSVIASPIGPITLIADDKALLSLSWGKSGQKIRGVENQPSHPILKAAAKQLGEYFRGLRKSFDVPVEPSGTEFQKLAWRELLKIPYGQSISYGEQARRIGRPKAVRAIGGANGRNPIGIIIPCHRVIGANGDLTGFGGGISIKKKLLELES